MQESTNTTTNELIADVFKKVGCTPEVREDNAFGIIFNDVYVVVQVNENRHSLTLYDFHWYHVSEDDIDGMLKLTKEMNNINSLGGIKLVLNKHDDYFHLSSSLTIPFIPEIPEIEEYLSTQLKELLMYRDVLPQLLEKEPNTNNPD